MSSYTVKYYFPVMLLHQDSAHSIITDTALRPVPCKQLSTKNFWNKSGKRNWDSKKQPQTS